MAPRKVQYSGQYDFFKQRNDEIVHKDHPLVRLSKWFNWDRFDQIFGKMFHSSNGRPGLCTRLMVGLHYLKQVYKLSDEGVLNLFVENSQWQYFCGVEYYSSIRPCDRSSLSRWRQKIGEKKLQLLLQETIDLAKKLGLLKSHELRTIIVDTTIQEKAIAFPTDSRLYFKALRALVQAGQKSGIQLRQTYKRVAKKSLIKQARLSHLRRFREALREQKRLKVYLGRVIRDIQRKAPHWQEDVRLSRLLKISQKIFDQKRNDGDKVYSVHAPETTCYSKGKVHKRYEFGSKVSVAVSAKNCWVVGIKSWSKNLHDVLTLKPALAQVEELTGVSLKRVFVDKGYKGKKHHPEDIEVLVSGQPSPHLKGAYRRRLSRRRSCVEAVIGHLKQDSRMDRNFLMGEQGDSINAVLSGAGHNLRKIMKEINKIPYFFVFFFKKCFRQKFLLFFHKKLTFSF